MMASERTMQSWWRSALQAGVLVVVGGGMLAAGVAQLARAEPAALPAPAAYRIDSYRIEATLEPAEHRLEATAVLAVRPTGEGEGPLTLELNPQLTVEEATVAGEAVTLRRLEAEAASTGEATGAAEEPGEESGDAASTAGEVGDEEPPPAVYLVDWQPPPEGGELTLRYAGPLVEDVLAGEKVGQIHNFGVDAHIGREGIYLDESGLWYPCLHHPEPAADELAREPELAHYELTVREVPGMLLVASGNRDGAALGVPRGETTTWRSPFPLSGLALVGGPHQAFERQVGPVLVSVHLSAESAPFADGLLDAIEHYLALYTPRLGPFPFTEMTVVENFFSSGFALPGFTVLAEAVIQMGERGLRPGYVDHELLHNWWGNGVITSNRGGNWAEGLATYTGNYMRKVLEGDEAGARRDRRDTVHALSRLPAERDLPLATFGEDDGANRLIGYQKGGMVFAQLARRLGEETTWRALARFARDNLGRVAGWREIQRAFEAESGQPLGAFFDFWVRSSGLPEIDLERAVYDPAAGQLAITVERRGGSGLPIEVPVRLRGEDVESGDLELPLAGDEATVTVEVGFAPRAVELDPDYRLLRRLPPELLMPTLSALGRGKPLTVVRAGGDAEAYGVVAEVIERRFEEAPEGSVRQLAAADLEASDLASGHALILGQAARTTAARELLERGPVRLVDGGFEVEGERFADDDQALLCCLGNSGEPGAVHCFYLANGEAGLGNAHLISFYGGNSLIVFDGGSPVLRRDFDQTERLEVETAGGG